MISAYSDVSATRVEQINVLYDSSTNINAYDVYVADVSNQYTLIELIDSSYTIQQILNASPKIPLSYLYPDRFFSISEFYDAGYSARDLQSDTSYNITSILNAGYTYNQLKSTPNNYDIGQLSDYGYYSDTLRTEGGFTANQLNKNTVVVTH